MTTESDDERQERLKQIRERRTLAESNIRQLGRYNGQEASWVDIDFLLSLLDSRATPRPTGWQAAGVQGDNPRNVLITFETPECAAAFIDNIEPAVGPIVAATRMRTRCVEKVGQLRDEWEIEAQDPRADLKNLIGVRARAKVDAARAIITELTYVTLDSTEQKEEKEL